MMTRLIRVAMFQLGICVTMNGMILQNNIRTLSDAEACAILLSPTNLKNFLLDDPAYNLGQLRNKSGETLFFRVISEKNVDAVRILIELNADVNQRSHGLAPLHQAAFQGSAEIAALLLNAGAERDPFYLSDRRFL